MKDEFTTFCEQMSHTYEVKPNQEQHRRQITIGGRPVDAESMEKFSESIVW